MTRGIKRGKQLKASLAQRPSWHHEKKMNMLKQVRLPASHPFCVAGGTKRGALKKGRLWCSQRVNWRVEVISHTFLGNYYCTREEISDRSSHWVDGSLLVVHVIIHLSIYMTPDSSSHGVRWFWGSNIFRATSIIMELGYKIIWRPQHDQSVDLQSSRVVFGLKILDAPGLVLPSVPRSIKENCYVADLFVRHCVFENQTAD